MVALRFQAVVEVVAAAIQPGDVKLGEVRVGLPHDGDDVDLFVLGDVGVLVLGQERLRLLGAVALRGGFHELRDAVEEGIEEAVGDIVLGGAPLVEDLVAAHAVVGVLVQVEGRQGRAGGHRHRQDDPFFPPAPYPPPGQEEKQDRSRRQTGQGRGHPLVHEQVVVLPGGHSRRLPEVQEDVLHVEGVVPEGELVVVAQAEAQGRPAPQEKGQPGSAGEAVEEKDQKGHGQDVQGHQGRGGEVLQKGPPGVLAVGEDQQQQAHAHAGAGQEEDGPGGVGRPLPPGPVRLRGPAEQKNLVKKPVQRITSQKMSKGAAKTAPLHYSAFLFTKQVQKI